jgi:5,10-methylenetetrahydromethanopterin reductase
MPRFGLLPIPDRHPEALAQSAELAERGGLDFYWVADEAPAAPFRDVFVAMTYVALRTKRIRIGTGIANPYTRNAAMLATTFASLDEIAPNRWVLGLGPGGSLPLGPLGIPLWNKPIRAVREAVLLCRRLFAGETVEFDGQMVTARKVQLFRPVAAPIYIAARGPQMMRLIGQVADGSMMSCPPDYVRFARDLIGEGAARAHRRVEDIDIGNVIPFAVGKNRSEARDLTRTAAAILLNDAPDRLIQAVGLPERKRQLIRDAVAKQGLSEAVTLVDDELTDIFTIAGPADYCIERCREHLRAGVTQFIFGEPFGANPTVAITTIVQEILPALR